MTGVVPKFSAFSVVVFSIFANLLMLTGPLFMLQVYDRVLASRSVETLTALFLLVAALYMLMACLDFARGRVMARFGARLQNRFDQPVFRAQLRAASIDPRAGRTPALRDIDAVQGFLSSPVMLAIIDLPWAPIFLAAIFVFHPMLGWLGVGGGAVLITLTILNQVLTRNRANAAQTEGEIAHGLASEALSGVEIVRSQAMEKNISERLNKTRKSALSKSLFASDWSGTLTSTIKSIRLLLQSSMLALGAWLVLQNELTAGAMIAGSIILGRALAPIEQVMGGWANLHKARQGWKRIQKLVSTQPKTQEKIALPAPEPYLSVSGITVIPPGSNVPTLRNISFELKPGEALGVIGRSGSGKSSLARVLLGLWPVVSGEVRLASSTLQQYRREDLGHHIGYLPQSVTLFRGTIAENIARMSLEPDADAVIKAAKLANAHELITGLVDGYDTQLDGTNGHLSGGQRQRIGLARAFYGDPVLLILDEPNSALDAEGAAALNRAIRGMKREKCSVIVMTHRPAAIAECEKLMIIEGGVVKDQGRKEEVLRQSVANADAIQRPPARVPKS